MTKSVSRRFYPLHKLDDYERHKLETKSVTETYLASAKLEKHDFRNWFVYLLKGEVSVIDQQGKQHFLLADDERFNRPLFDGETGFRKVTANSELEIIKYDKQLYEILRKGDSPGLETVEDIAVDEVESQIFEQIFAAYSANEIELPSLPDVAVKVRHAIENEHVTIDDVSQIVEADPALVAQLIKLANSAVFRAREPIQTIRDAVLRIGLKQTRDYVMVFTIKNLFNTDSKKINKLMKTFYRHSIQVAAMSFAIAQFQKTLLPEHALLAGLLHDIGVIPILNYASKLTLSNGVGKEMEDVVEKLKPLVGGMLLRQWQLEESFVQAAEKAEDWGRNSSGELEYCDLVIMSQLHPSIRQQVSGELPRLEDVPLFKKMESCSSDLECNKKILAIAHDEIAELMKLLS